MPTADTQANKDNLLRVRHNNGELMSNHDYVVAREIAVALLLKAGFRLHQASQSTTSTYYVHPAREPYLLRVSDHSFKKGAMGLSNTVARLTISRKDKYLTEWHIRNLVVAAIGRYFVDDPKPSRYYGKKGTWETGVSGEPPF